MAITHSREDRRGLHAIQQGKQTELSMRGTTSQPSGSSMGDQNIANNFGTMQCQAGTKAAAPQIQRRKKCDYCKQKQDTSENLKTEALLVSACPPFARLKQTDLFCREYVAHLRSLYQNWLPR